MTCSAERTSNVLGVALVDTFNELVNVNLITGLDRYFPGASTGTPVAFSDGNIMLGGGGSDFIEGRGGNDIIDGDARLHVELTRDANGNIFAGSQIVREILTDQAVGPTFGPTIDSFTGEPGRRRPHRRRHRHGGVRRRLGGLPDQFGDGRRRQYSCSGPTAIRVLNVTHTAPTVGAVNDGTDTLTTSSGCSSPM